MNIIQDKMQTFRFTDRIIDLILLFISARLAIIAERVIHYKSWHALDPQSFHFSALLIIFLIWTILIHLLESDLVYRRTPVWDIIKTTAIISFIGVTTTITLDFLLKTDLFKRSTIGFFGIISFLLLLLKRGGMKYFLSSIRQEGFDPKNILIIGSHKRAERIIHEFKEHREYGLRIRSILDPDFSRIGLEVDGMLVTGDMSNFKETLMDLEIDEVFFAVDLDKIKNIQDIFSLLDTIGVSYHMMINESVLTYLDGNLNKPYRVEPAYNNYYGISMLSFSAFDVSNFKIYLKGVLEKIFICIIFLIYLPIIIFFAFFVKLYSKYPIFEKQERIGLYGRRFNYYMFNLKTSSNNINLTHKARSSINETFIKNIIVRLNLTEAPAMLNVIKGEINFIGPYPMLKTEYSKTFNEFSYRRLSMKPGITGLWRFNDTSYNDLVKEKVELDLEYIDNWSLMLDFKIAIKTVSTVLSGTGM